MLCAVLPLVMIGLLVLARAIVEVVGTCCCTSPCIPCTVCIATPVVIPVTLVGGTCPGTYNTSCVGQPICTWSSAAGAGPGGTTVTVQFGLAGPNAFVKVTFSTGLANATYQLILTGTPVDCTATRTLPHFSDSGSGMPCGLSGIPSQRPVVSIN
jgi:hypothetical protein